MRLHLALAAAIAAGCLAAPASAALLARPGGLYYDTVLDITWLGDTNVAQSYGLSDTGLITQQGAEYVAGLYLYQNPSTGVLYTDWRLPTLGPDVDNFNPLLPGSGGQLPNGQGAPGTGWGAPDDSGIYSELGWMYYANLGGQPRCLAYGAEPCVFNPNYGLPDYGYGPDPSPFTELKLDFYWTNVQAAGLNAYWAFTFDDGNQNPRAPHNGQEPVAYVWLVHEGDVAFDPNAITAVPEPASWALMIAGFGAAGAALRRGRRGLRLAANP